MNDSENEFSIDEIAEEFIERLESGERPSIETYKQRFPNLADQLDAVLPALLMLEDVDSQPPQQDVASDDSIPRMLGEYKLLNEIGRGGMGIVFEARHNTMHRRVALKVLPKSMTEKSTYVARFLTEARSAGKLHHTNIVPVFDVGEDHGLHFYAMQFINGDNLDRIISDIRILRSRDGTTIANDYEPKSQLSQSIALSLVKGKTTIEYSGLSELIQPIADPSAETDWMQANQDTDVEISSHIESVFNSGNTSTNQSRVAYHQRTAAVGVQVAQALDYAHIHGVLHRDIKPANLILDTNGTVWVTDFGLAKLETANLTHTGDIIGTLRYMAPERFKGKADARSDIYSLGLTLYELCTLQIAYEGDQVQLLGNGGVPKITPPRKIDPTIPVDLEIIILKSLESDPKRRYQSAIEMAEDLNLFIAGRPIRARRVSFAERFWMVCLRNPLASSLAGCIAALLFFLAFGSLKFALYKSDQVQAEIKTRKQTQARLYDSRLDQSRMRRLSAQQGQRYKSLEALRDAKSLLPHLDLTKIELDQANLELRNEAIAAINLLDVHPEQIRNEKTWTPHQRIGFTDDRTLFAIGMNDGATNIFRAAAGENEDELIATIPGPGMMASYLLLSPDGKYLATSNQKSKHSLYRDVTFHLWEVASPESPMLKVTGSLNFQFSPDSKQAVVSTIDDIKIISLADGKIGKTIDRKSRFVCFSDHGRQLAWSSLQTPNQIEIWDIQTTPKHAHTLKSSDDGISAMGWSSGQELLAVGTLKGTVHYWRKDYAAPFESASVQQNEISRLHIHPTRAIIATDSRDATIRFLDSVTGEISVSVDSDAHLLYAGFSADGKLGFSDDRKKHWGIWDFSTPALTAVSHAKTFENDCHFHPKHQTVVARTIERGFEFIDASTRKTLGKILLKVKDGSIRNFRFAPDGTQIYSTGDAFRIWNINVEKTKIGFKISSQPPTVLDRIGTSNCVAISNSGNLIATNHQYEILMINLKDGNIQTLGRHGGVDSLQFTADDSRLLSGTRFGKGVSIWDVSNSSLLKKILPNDMSAKVAAHPIVSSRILTSSGRTQTWEIPDLGSPTLELGMPTMFESPACFSSDGNMIVSLIKNDTLIFFDVPSKKTIATLKSFNDSRIVDMEFSLDGSKLLLSCFDDLQIVDIANLRSELDSLKLNW